MIWPVLQPIFENAQSELVLMAALSIFTDLTAATVAVDGPCYGLHYVDDMEDEAKAADYPQAYIDMMRAVDGVAVQLYYDAWDNATQALNQSTLLSDMDMLTGYLTPDDETLLPDEWKKLPAWDEGVDSFSPTDDRFVALGVVHGWGQCDDLYQLHSSCSYFRRCEWHH